jgi:HK97 family phage prohead protease
MKTIPEALQELVSSRRADGDVVHRTFGVSVKAGTLNEEERSVRVIASTEAIDSYDETVKQDWRLERYQKNPVVLWAHNRVGFLGMGGDPEKTLPIGHATDVAVVNGHLEATLNFADEAATPLAERVWQGFRQKSIRAVSVGFRPGKIVKTTDDDGNVLSVSLEQNELFEISAVPIPANADAVALSADERARERSALLARADGQENETMKFAELEAKAAELEKQLTALQGELAAKAEELTAAVAAKEKAEQELAELGDAPTKLKAAQERITELEGEAAERDVDALINEKLVPAQRDAFLALRKSNPEQFKTITDGLPKLNLSDDALPPEPTPTTNKSTKKGSPSKLLKSAEQAADAARGVN